MDKYYFSNKLIKSKPQDKNKFIKDKCRDKIVLDVGCIRHKAIFALKDEEWLHGKIKSVAKKVIGIDYIQSEVEILNNNGYEIICADITKPIEFKDYFDVIVAGDIIEHLSNFDGFFENCNKYLKKDGIIIITTPNPFFIDEIYYVIIKNTFLINPEHTCWIDPMALNQLSERYDYFIDEIYFIKNSWKLKNIICESKDNQYDILQDIWNNNSNIFKIYKEFIGILFNMLFFPFKLISTLNSKLVKYSDYIAILKRHQLKQ